MSGNTVKLRVAFSGLRQRPEAPQEAATAGAAMSRPPPTRLARQLALAYFVEREIEAGRIKDYAEAARRLRVSRARMTQVMNLRYLPVAVQETILTGRLEINAHRLREDHHGPRSLPSWRPIMSLFP